MSDQLATIRYLSFADLPYLHSTFPQPRANEHEKRLQRQERGLTAYYGILVDGVLVGIQLIRWDGPSDEQNKVLSEYPEIGSVFVLPEYRQRGLASQLLKHAESLIKTAGFNYAGLIIKDNNIPSIALHLKVGYKVVGEATRHHLDPSQPRSYYLKQL